MKRLTLCLIQQDGRLLLGLKKRGFGAGKWNGLGGKIEPGETIAQAAAREVAEEARLTLMAADQRGILTFEFIDDPVPLEVHVFAVTDFMGEPKETEEMKPQWFDIRSLPYDHMWADDRYWLPKFLAGEKFRGHFIFQDEETLLAHDLSLVSDKKVFAPAINS